MEMSAHPLRVVFFGTSSDFTLEPLNRIARQHTLAAIVESGPRGCRRKSLTFPARLFEIFSGMCGKPSLWMAAQRLRLPYFYLCRGNEDALAEFLHKLEPDVACVASFNQLLPPQILSIPKHGFINLHPSLLPKYRGPNVWFWQYYCMDLQGGVTIHFLDEGEDTGDILKQAEMPISLGLEVASLRRNLICLGAELMAETLDELADGTFQPLPQRYLPCPQRARRIKEGEDLFDWPQWSLTHTYHFLRGLHSRFTIFNKKQGFWGWFPWKVDRYETRPGESAPGKIHLDRQGFYFSHPQGRIRLSPDISAARLCS